MAKTRAWAEHDSFGDDDDESIALPSVLIDWYCLEAVLCEMADMPGWGDQGFWGVAENITHSPATMLIEEMDFIFHETF